MTIYDVRACGLDCFWQNGERSRTVTLRLLCDLVTKKYKADPTRPNKVLSRACGERDVISTCF